MSNNLIVTIKKKSNKGQAGFEGNVEFPGLKPTKLARKDGVTLFANTNSLKTVARSVAKKMGGLDVEYVEPVRKAAKRSTKKQEGTTENSES